MSTNTRPPSPRRSRAFSMVEMLIALTITATLLTAALAALDASFKGYKATTEGASTHVVSRIVINRLMTMIRTGTQFAPAPIDALDTDQNPVRDSDHIEFVAFADEDDGTETHVRVERRDAASAENGPFELYYIQTDFKNGAQVRQTVTPLLSNVQAASFTLDFDVGDRLKRATIDLTIRPNDVQDARLNADVEAPTIRLVSSTTPRKLDE